MAMDFSTTMTLEQLLHHLEQRRNLPREWKLERVKKFAEWIGITLRGNYIHVGGTNGKGSTCAMLEAGFRSIGLRTGCYTSPHLVHWNERIRINGEPIHDKDFHQLLSHVIDAAQSSEMRGNDSLSGFEILTVAALLYFESECVDIAIVEVGLGGRLDATNIILPKICAITTVGLDHEEILGETLSSIALEKVGIGKSHVPLVLGKMSHAARKTIEMIAAERKIPIVLAHAKKNLPPLLHMHGLEQANNWAVVECIAKIYVKVILGKKQSAMECFLQGAAEARWEGRWEKKNIAGHTWVIDCTHNVCGLPFLRANWQREISMNEKMKSPIIIAAMLGERRAQAILPFLGTIGSHFFLVELAEPRALSGKQLQKILKHSFCGPMEIIHQEELGNIQFPQDCRPILVTGSILLAGEVLRALPSIAKANFNSCPLNTF
ncbi:MAG: hypothetical protein LBG86_00845 [Puniceicoccales bacterium]|jgi:dihydrofolate synthase/folylpolyglutamate synthase|nr:hypothetical protein [Puniceicoccales bacterium]